MKINCGDIIDGYTIVLICEQRHYGLALARQDNGYEVTDWATIDYSCLDREKNLYWHKGMTEKEAKMYFFEGSPMMLSKYEVYEKVRDDLLREEAEAQVSVYIYKLEDIDYKKAKELQTLFNIDELIYSYKIYNRSDDWKYCIERYVKEHNIHLEE